MILVANILSQSFPLLNATDSTDLVFWDIPQLYSHQDKALQRLALLSGGFVETVALNLVAGTSTYALPPRHLSTRRVSVAGLRLDPASIAELEALDNGWANRTGTPTHFVRDQQGLGQIRVWPTPEADAQGAIIFHTFPDAASTLLPVAAPLVFQDAILLAALAGARGHESKGAMPEVAGWCLQFVEQAYYPIAADIWGGAQ